MDFKIITGQVIDELKTAIDAVDDKHVSDLIHEITAAHRIFVYGLGRERLVLQAFAMRLMHLGLAVYMVGDVTTPRIQQGDLFITSSGTGYLATVEALMKIVKKSGARVSFFTASTNSILLPYVDNCVMIPAQTMNTDEPNRKSIQPMGTVFEQTQLIICDLMVLLLKEKLNRNEEDMVDFHTNLE